MAKKLGLANNPLLAGPTLVERQTSSIPYKLIPISAINKDTNQPRVHFNDESINELADSIREYGVLSPVLVRPGSLPGKYQLISGERRLRAAKVAGLSSIPAIVESKEDKEGSRTLAIQLVENIQREDLTPLEKSHAIEALRAAYGLSIRDISKKLGISKSAAQRSLDLLDLPDDLLNALRQGVSESKVLILSKVKDFDKRKAFLEQIDKLTRQDLEELINRKESGKIISTKVKAKNTHKISPEDVRLIDEMRRALGLKISLTRSEQDTTKGKVTIEFYSDSDLQAIFRSLVTQSV